MALNFKELAKRQTTLSSVMVDRTKKSTDEMIADYPDGFTIIAFDYVMGKKSKDKYPVYNIKEDPTIFSNGGTVLDRIFSEFVKACDGDVEAASNELRRQGGLKVSLEMDETKNGDEYVKVNVL